MIKQLFYMNSAEILDCSFAIYKKSFWQQIAYSFVISTIGSVIVGLVTILLTVLGTVALLPFIAGNLRLDTLPAPLFVAFGLLFVVILLLLYLQQSLLTTGNMILSKQVFYTGKTNFTKAIKEAFVTFPRVFSVVLAEILVMLPIVLLLLAVGYLLVGNMIREWISFGITPTFSTPLALLILAIALIYYFIVIVLRTLFCLGVPCAVFHKKAFFGALIQSYQIVKPNFRKFLGIVFIWSFMVSLFAYSIIIVFAIVGSGLGIIASSSSFEFEMLYTYLRIYNYVFTGLFEILVAPLSAILYSVLYFNQLIKREGLDISISFKRMKGGL